MVKAVVLAGGSSPSMFPVARDSLPKQFKKLGKHNVYIPMEEEKKYRSSFQEIVNIASKIGEVVVLTRKEYRFVVRTQLEEIGVRTAVIYDKNLGISSLNEAYNKVLSYFKGERVVFLPSDHIIPEGERKKFVSTLEKAINAGGTVTIGTPISKGLNSTRGFIRIENGVVTDYTTVLPEDADPNVWHRHTGIIVADSPGISVIGMHAIIGLYGWHELNNYAELENYALKDAVSVRSKNSFVYSETNKKYALVDVSDVGVIDTGDVVVVFNRKKTLNGEDLYGFFKGTDMVRFAPTVYKPWGRFTNIHDGKMFKIKLLEILPGASISLQKHFHRSEHWIIVEGTAEVTLGNETKILTAGQSTFVPIGEVHKVRNPGKKILKIVEVQYGEYLGDDDIVRLEDPYGRSEEEKLL